MSSLIIFTPYNMRQIIDGKKTQTRRIIKERPKVVHAYKGNGFWETEKLFGKNQSYVKCPYGLIGSRLVCRELYALDTEGVPFYTADHLEEINRFEWKSALFMPMEYSRVTLLLTNIQAQKVQNISDADCIAEGIEWTSTQQEEGYTFDKGVSGFFPTPKTAYQAEWDKLNCKRDVTLEWTNNPYVWVLTFEVDKIKEAL